MGDDFLLFVLNEDVEELDVPVVGGGEDVPGGVCAGGEREQLGGHRLALFPRRDQVFGTLLFLFRDNACLIFMSLCLRCRVIVIM